MASTISTPTTYLLCSSTHKKKKSTLFSISSSLLLHPQTTNSRISTSIPQLGLGLLAPWNGLRHLGVSIKNKFIKTERKERSQNKGIHASLFGVGAPEALVIGVVALLVFGPKGLAEVARNLGKTLRAFQPTIRELQDVSREFKSTLEREIGLDEPPSMQRTSSSTTASSSTNKENSQTTLDPNGAPQLEATAAQQQMIPQEQSENESQLQDDAPPAKPFNIGDVLVQAQLRSTAARLQEKEAAQEVQSGLEPQPEGVAPTISTLKQPESEQEISSKQLEREQEISSKQPENDQETPSMQSAEVTK